MENKEMQFLSENELENINGGGIIKWIIKGIEAAGVVDGIKDFASGFKQGMKEDWPRDF